MAFGGFTVCDFQSGVDATNWRRELGDELRKVLSATLAVQVSAYAFPHKPELYLRHDYDRRMYQAKLHVGTAADGLNVGYCVECKLSSDHTDDRELARSVDDDWHRFLHGIGTGSVLRTILSDIARPCGLCLRAMSGGELEFRLGPEQLADGGTLGQLHSALTRWPDNRWLDVFVDRFIDGEAAVDKGTAVTMEITDVLVACWPLYEASLRSDFSYQPGH